MDLTIAGADVTGSYVSAASDSAHAGGIGRAQRGYDKGSRLVDAEDFQPVSVFFGIVLDQIVRFDLTPLIIPLGEIDQSAHSEHSTYMRKRRAFA